MAKPVVSPRDVFWHSYRLELRMGRDRVGLVGPRISCFHAEEYLETGEVLVCMAQRAKKEYLRPVCEEITA